MKWFYAVAIAVLVSGLMAARAQGPDDQYVQIYNLIQEGNALESRGQSNPALAKYLEARTALQRFQRSYPDWNPQVVKFRLGFLDSKVAAHSEIVPAAAAAAADAFVAAANKPAPGGPPQASPVQPGKVAVPDETQNQFRALNELIRQLQADNTVLEAKLKEALSAQPAATDPRELTKAEERIKSLQKENDLLKVSLNDAKTKSATAPPAEPKTSPRAEQALADANRKLAEQSKKANALALENKELQNKLDSLIDSNRKSDSGKATKKALEESNHQLAEQTQLAAKLRLERDALQARLQSSAQDPQVVAALRTENQMLKRQVASLKLPVPAAQKTNELSRQLSKAQAQIALLESDKEMLRVENAALQNRVKQSSRPAVAAQAKPAPAKADDSTRVKQLEKERAEMQKKLEAALKEAKGRTDKASGRRIVEMENQLTTLRARLEVFEARQVPYTAEELACFKEPAPRLTESAPKAANQSSKAPPGTVLLVAEAQRYFAEKRLDKAEEKYLQVLHQDDQNVRTLANLAAIQIELGNLAEAEKHIDQAVALAPGDAHSLSILGYLKFKEQKYDDAINALSKAAKEEPENAEIQNYLGLTLSEKGMRGPAETALRKAIQINPSYGSAHNNLAVVYLSQQPPSVELARWHYQKALAAGLPRNPELEKMLQARGGAEKSQ